MLVHFRKTGFRWLATSALTCVTAPALAQAAAGPAPAAPAAANPVFSNAEIVVTGTASRQAKFTAPYSVSTIDRAKIDQLVPHSVTDMLRATPGLTVEASGGEGGSENVVIRGLPWAGWRLIDFTQDGMPLLESNTEQFMNIDELYRVDLGNTRAEVVRGGTAPLFSDNASGGTVNMITNHGTDVPQGLARITTGTGNQIRGDATWSGPIADGLSVALSGFYRRGDGLRDPGFSGGDRGGQIRAGFTWKFNGGRIWGDVSHLNDHGVFYTDVPLTDPRNGASLAGLIDPKTGTLDSSTFRNVAIRTLVNGQPTTLHRDLRDGIHPDVTTATLGGDHDLGAGFTVTDTFRHTSGTLDYDALFNGASPSDSSAFLAGQLAGAKAAFGPNVASLRDVLAGTNTPYDPAKTAGLVMTNGWNYIHTRFRYDANDIHLSKSLETPIGIHDLTGGLYYSHYVWSQSQYRNSILTNVKTNPDLLDIQALNAAGAVVGSVTENGFTNYGSGSQNGSLHGDAFAFYVADTWHITPRWSIDGGVRRVDRRQSGVQGILGTVDVLPNGPLPARSVQGVVSYVPHSENLHGTSWTVGSGYTVSQHLNVFGRYTRTFSYPRFDTILGAATLPGTTTPLPVATVQQAEGGVKFAIPHLQLSATGFHSKFNKLNGGTQVAAANGTITNSNIIFNTRTTGVEFEAVVTPVAGLDINATGMLQNPKIISITTLTGLSAQSSQGGEIPRVPKTQFTIEPSYHFTTGAVTTRMFATIFTIGRRFQDFSNLSRLPGYTSLDLGVTLTHRNGLQVQALVQNVTNVVGLTEGNARASVLGTGGVGDATVGRSIFGRNFTLSLSKKF